MYSVAVTARINQNFMAGFDMVSNSSVGDAEIILSSSVGVDYRNILTPNQFGTFY